jgi:hypothetical protein
MKRGAEARGLIRKSLSPLKPALKTGILKGGMVEQTAHEGALIGNVLLGCIETAGET